MHQAHCLQLLRKAYRIGKQMKTDAGYPADLLPLGLMLSNKSICPKIILIACIFRIKTSVCREDTEPTHGFLLHSFG